MNKNMPGGKFWWSTAFYLPVCLFVCLSVCPSVSPSACLPLSLCLWLMFCLSVCSPVCRSVRLRWIIHYSPWGSCQSHFHAVCVCVCVYVCVYVWRDVAFPASCPIIRSVAVTCSLSRSLFTTCVSLLLLLVVNIKSTTEAKVGGGVLRLKVWNVWHVLRHPLNAFVYLCVCVLYVGQHMLG